MALPDAVLLTPLQDDRETIVARIRSSLDNEEFELMQVARLGWDSEEEAFCAIGEETRCTRESEALEIARNWEGLVLVYDVGDVLQRVYFCVWELDGQLAVSLQIPPQVLWFESDEYSEGEWFQKFVLTITDGIRPEAVGYGVDYKNLYQSLNREQVLERLGSGNIFMMGEPSIHLLAVRLVETSVIERALMESDVRVKPNYFRTTSGYHVISRLPCDPV